MRWHRGLFLLLASLLVSPCSVAVEPAPLHREFDELLRAHVHWERGGVASRVDYAGMRQDQARLRRYLASLARVDKVQFARWRSADRHAFLVNAYNAATLELVLNAGPGLHSIKDIGGLFSSPWGKPFVALLGKVRSLDEIEQGLIRGAADYRDPRLHFALNCASLGCPALRPEAYVGDRLDRQLDDQARRFLRDRRRNRFDPVSGRLRVSRIFSWYREDFDHLGGGVPAFLATFSAELGLDAQTARRLASGDLALAYTDYDWSLNGGPP